MSRALNEELLSIAERLIEISEEIDLLEKKTSTGSYLTAQFGHRLREGTPLQVPCPHCGQQRLVAAVLGTPLYYHCLSCGHEGEIR